MFSELEDLNNSRLERKMISALAMQIDRPYIVERLHLIAGGKFCSDGTKKVAMDIKFCPEGEDGAEYFVVYLPQRYNKKELRDLLPIKLILDEFTVTLEKIVQLSATQQTAMLVFKRQSSLINPRKLYEKMIVTAIEDVPTEIEGRKGGRNSAAASACAGVIPKKRKTGKNSIMDDEDNDGAIGMESQWFADDGDNDAFMGRAVDLTDES